ncbi:hypothetical protein B0T16DRAFT_331879 [Cercophora newfieldiana]|uniref:Secreted protein n=1 Tax=Cercophora newfieldiana TaxID=92897 RepID=A0AA39Y297_9PEZI|nr:hypothetical protein B0T16DRAFT_331879 [Cercophora newfieldiana]
MRLSNVLPFAGLVAALPAAEPDFIGGILPSAGPSGHEVQIDSIAYAGSGCNAGTVAGLLASDLTAVTLLFSEFIAESGKGVAAGKLRRNCNLLVKLKYPAGWQFSVFKADYRGYAQIPAGDVGTCKSTYYFQGISGQATSQMTINGPYENNYLKSDQFGLQTTVWSPCGQEGILSINSEVRIAPKDSNTAKAGLLTVDSADLKFKQIHYLQWQKCTRRA